MCNLSRREFLAGSAAMIGAASPSPAINGAAWEIGKPEMVTSGVHFFEGDLTGKGYCNNGWIIFEDYVLVVDANYPSGAQEIIQHIRGITDKPIRFAFDTHHHGDHVYGNQVMVEGGAVPLAHTGVIEEMRRYETGYYGSKPGRWESDAKNRPDVKSSKLKPPSVLFPRELYFDDGRRRVELVHLGVAHTHGDAFAWLPQERLLFTGDACVNGPYNFVGDGNVEQWIKTLDGARKLGVKTICPGHGPRGDSTLLDDQQEYFKQLRERVGAMVSAKKSDKEIGQSIERIRAELSAIQRIARYVSPNGIAAHVGKVYQELTGNQLPPASRPVADARLRHASDHGLRLAVNA